MATTTATINGETVELVLLPEKKPSTATAMERRPTAKIAASSSSSSSSSAARRPSSATPPPPSGPTDTFGFYLENDDVTDSCHKSKAMPPSVIKQRKKKEEERLRKWQEMRSLWPASTVQRKVKDRARKGIPLKIRPWAWWALSNASAFQERYPSTAVVLTPAALKSIPQQTIEEIERDLPRTFPRHTLFATGKGQSSLRRILQVSAIHDPVVGYCQGQGFIAGMLLIVGLSEDQAMQTLIAALSGPSQAALTSRHVLSFQLRELFLPDMAGAQKALYVFERLGRKHLGALWVHLEGNEVHPTMYATEWLMTVFCRGFSFDLVGRVWDIFLREDFKIVYRVALALLKNAEAELLAVGFEGIMALLRRLPELTDAETVMAIALGLGVSRREIGELEAAFAAGAGAEA